MRRIATTVLAAGLILQTGIAHTSETIETQSEKKQAHVPETLGFVEWVVMRDTGLRLKARLDTGAKTSSLHAVNVEEFERNDQEWVRFQIPLGDHEDQPGGDEIDHEDVILDFEQPVYRTVLIKRKSAESQRRYVVKMKFCIAGTFHKTQFSLTDRSNFSYPVLLGRRFMRDDHILIDSANSFMAVNDCEHNSLETLAKQNS